MRKKSISLMKGYLTYLFSKGHNEELELSDYLEIRRLELEAIKSFLKQEASFGLAYDFSTTFYGISDKI